MLRRRATPGTVSGVVPAARETQGELFEDPSQKQRKVEEAVAALRESMDGIRITRASLLEAGNIERATQYRHGPLLLPEVARNLGETDRQVRVDESPVHEFDDEVARFLLAADALEHVRLNRDRIDVIGPQRARVVKMLDCLIVISNRLGHERESEMRFRIRRFPACGRFETRMRFGISGKIVKRKPEANYGLGVGRILGQHLPIIRHRLFELALIVGAVGLLEKKSEIRHLSKAAMRYSLRADVLITPKSCLCRVPDPEMSAAEGARLKFPRIGHR